MPIIEAVGVSLNYETFGDNAAPAVLLVMGASAPMTRWPDEFCQNLASAGYWVIRFDNRDAGASERFDHLGLPAPQTAISYSLEEMAEDAVNLLSALGVGSAHLVGVSMGGAIAQIAAIAHPDRVITLTSMMSTSSARGLPYSSARVRALFESVPRAVVGFLETREEQVQALLLSAEAGRSPAYPMPLRDIRQRAESECDGGFTLAGRARQSAALRAAGDRRDALNQLRVPTLVIHGDADELFPLEHGRDTAAAVPGAVLVVIPGLGHDLPPGAVGKLVGILVTHLAGDRLSPDGGPDEHV